MKQGSEYRCPMCHGARGVAADVLVWINKPEELNLGDLVQPETTVKCVLCEWQGPFRELRKVGEVEE